MLKRLTAATLTALLVLGTLGAATAKTRHDTDRNCKPHVDRTADHRCGLSKTRHDT